MRPGAVGGTPVWPMTPWLLALLLTLLLLRTLLLVLVLLLTLLLTLLLAPSAQLTAVAGEAGR